MNKARTTKKFMCKNPLASRLATDKTSKFID